MQRLSYDICKPIYDLLNITFNPAQEAVVKEADRFPVIGGGERGGKSFVTGAILIPHIIALPEMKPERFYDPLGKLKFDENRDKPRNPDFVLFGPTYAEPRQEFQFIENWLNQLGYLAGGLNKPSKPMDGPWRLVTKHGIVVATWSMEDPTSIRSIDLEGGACCEAGKMPYSGIERVQGRISAKKGFMLYSGTMETAQQWYQDWMLMGKRPNHLNIRSYSIPTYANLHEFPGGREDEEIKRLEAWYPDDIFAMRVLAEPRPPRTRVLKEFGPEHIKRIRVPKDADIRIFTDPGYASAYAVLFVAVWMERDKEGKEVGMRFHALREFYEQGKTTDDIIQLCKQTKEWKVIKKGVIDVAARGHRDASESALEKWEKLTTGITFSHKYWREDPLIERIRVTAKQNRITIDPSCRGLIAELGLGEPVFDEMHFWKYPTDRDGRVIGEKPIDKWNHSCKALGYGLLDELGQVESLKKATSINRLRGNKGKTIRDFRR